VTAAAATYSGSVVVAGGVDSTTTVRASGTGNAFSSGVGVEIDYGSVATATGRVFAYDRSGAARKDMVVDGATVALYSGGSERIKLQADGTMRFTAVTASTVPTNAASAMGYYQTGTKFVLWYNDAGTVRYKYLDMTGTGVTWVHTTTAP
jgi:hypothetical protein